MTTKAESSLIKVILSGDLHPYVKALGKALAAAHPLGVFSVPPNKGSEENGMVDTGIFFMFPFMDLNEIPAKIRISFWGFERQISFELDRIGYVGKTFHRAERRAFTEFPGDIDAKVSSMIINLNNYLLHDATAEMIELNHIEAKLRADRVERREIRYGKAEDLRRDMMEHFNIKKPSASFEAVYEVVSQLKSFDKIVAAMSKLLPYLK